MGLPTFSNISRELGIERCRGIQSNGQRCYATVHATGGVIDGIVHWSDRRVTKAGIKRFLWLASDPAVTKSEAPWRRRWIRLQMVRGWLGRIHVRLSKDAWDQDKAELRAMLVKVPTSDHARAEAMAWASRR